MEKNNWGTEENNWGTETGWTTIGLHPKWVYWNGNHWRNASWNVKSQLKIVIKKTSTTHWTVLGSNTLRVLLLMILSRCWTATACDISTAFLMLLWLNVYWWNHQVNTIRLETVWGCWSVPCTGWSRHPHFGLNLAFTDAKLIQIPTVIGPLNFTYCATKMTYWFVELANGQKSVLADSDRKSYWKLKEDWNPQTSVNFLGRTLKCNGDGIDVSMNTAYVTDLSKLCGMENSKPSPTTGASTVSKIQPEPLDRNEHKNYRG